MSQVMPLGSRDADPGSRHPDTGPSGRHRRQCCHCRSVASVGPPKRAHLDRRPTGDGSLAPPRKCIIQISGFQHPKTAYVLLGLQVRPVGDENLTIGLRPQRPSSNIACCSSSVIPSNFPGSMYPKQMYFIHSSLFPVTQRAVAHRSVIR